jgi:hypothetical protein
MISSNKPFGSTKNPWDFELTPGGSSGVNPILPRSSCFEPFSIFVVVWLVNYYRPILFSELGCIGSYCCPDGSSCYRC